MIAFAVLILVNAYILMNTGTTQAVAPGEKGWTIFGTMGCGWTRKQLEHMKRSRSLLLSLTVKRVTARMSTRSLRSLLPTARSMLATRRFNNHEVPSKRPKGETRQAET